MGKHSNLTTLVLSALAGSPEEGIPARELLHLIPENYIPSAERSTSMSLKLRWLMSTGYVSRSESRLASREGKTGYDGGGGFIWYITPLGMEWLAAGCPRNWRRGLRPESIRRRETQAVKDARKRRKLLQQVAAMLYARSQGYGRHTPVRDRFSASAALYGAGLSFRQVGVIFGVSRERIRQYVDDYASGRKHRPAGRPKAPPRADAADIFAKAARLHAAAGLSLREIALCTDFQVSTSTVHQLVTGKRIPMQHRLDLIMNILEVMAGEQQQQR